VRGGDVLADHRGPLAFGGAQPGEQAVGQLLGFVELADLQIGGDAEGVEPVPVQEPGPRAVLVRIGDAERFLGSPPGSQRLRLVVQQRALFGMARRDPRGRRRRRQVGDVL
jgi:hypothetical protein